MEVEVKYLIDDDTKINDILQDDVLVSLECEGTRKVRSMHAVYYDTADRDLEKIKAAFRVRLEGDEYVATIKMNGSVTDGLHRRYELNKIVSDEDFIESPSLKIFEEDDEVMSKLGAVIQKPVETVLEMNYVRELFEVKYESTRMEVAVDQGDIWTPMGSAPICEAEFEIIEGNAEDLVSLGEIICKTYDLKPENRSKFARGIALVNSQQE